MISSLRLINFKTFENQFLEFRPLTLLSGLNSTGKSSVLQSLLLLRQSYQQQRLLIDTGLVLNGELVKIGTAQDAFCERAKNDDIGFEILWETYQAKWHFCYALNQKEADVLNNGDSSVDSQVYQLSLFNERFHYLQAERIGPRSYNEMSDHQVRRLGQIGTRGEYTGHFLFVNGLKPIPIANFEYPQAKSMNLIDQVEAWMREVSPGTRIKIKSNPEMDLLSLQYFYGDGNPYRATNVGFGISYTLPIIVAVLASTPGTLILIENPEAHLHPKGQSKMGELLALAASCGVQVVIETHSDHILNGIRLAVHSGKLHHKDVQLHYFSREEENGQVVTQVISPRLDADGRIDTWPEGFFDQAEKDLMELL